MKDSDETYTIYSRFISLILEAKICNNNECNCYCNCKQLRQIVMLGKSRQHTVTQFPIVLKLFNICNVAWHWHTLSHHYLCVFVCAFAFALLSSLFLFPWLSNLYASCNFIYNTTKSPHVYTESLKVMGSDLNLIPLTQIEIRAHVIQQQGQTLTDT